MNQQEQAAYDKANGPSVPIAATQPDPARSLTIDLLIDRFRDGYGGSDVGVLFWALSDYRNKLYKGLIRELRGQDEEFAEAGGFLNDLETCDQLIGKLFMGLQEVAAENANKVWAMKHPTLCQPDQAVRAVFEERAGEKIRAILNRHD